MWNPNRILCFGRPKMNTKKKPSNDNFEWKIDKLFKLMCVVMGIGVRHIDAAFFYGRRLISLTLTHAHLRFFRSFRLHFSGRRRFGVR